MAVYTEVSTAEAHALFQQLKLGELTSLTGCSGGIENTNYFASTEQGGATHDYVLTLFERLSFEQLPFYLRLMKHLAQRGIAVPEPVANARGTLVFDVKGKPAAVVDKLRGRSELAPTSAHCAQVGAMLARMHLAGRDFELSQPNLRGLDWWNETVPVVLPFLTKAQKDLITQELAYQNHVAAQSSYAALPRGPIHADLFRDNVMFDTVDGVPVLSGFFDFYFAGVDTWLFDLAVCLNDWCIDLTTGAHDAQRAHSFIAAYSAQRPLLAAERELLPAMLRAGALRFWLSRLWDYHLPREASMLQAHDPSHFERVLRHRATDVRTSDSLMATA
jgi:homoserine kinase type II